MPELESAGLRRLLAYWESKRQGRAMPARADIDPLDFHELLPNIILLDVEGERFRVRVVGTGVVARFGDDYTGRYLDELDFGDQRDAILAHYGECRRTAAPHVSRTLFTSVRGVSTRMERLILPLSVDGATVDMMLACLEFAEVGRPPT